MVEKTKQKFNEEIKKLPINLQGAITSFDWEKISEEIGKKYLFTESEINDFQIEIGLVLVGLEDQDSFALNVENNVVVSKDEASKISNEVNEKIFTPILTKIDESTVSNHVISNMDWKQRVDYIVSGGK